MVTVNGGDVSDCSELGREIDVSSDGCMTKPRGRLDDGKHNEHASRNQHFDKSPEVKIRPNSSETIPIDQTGFNTNPKGGNRPKGMVSRNRCFE